MNEDEDAQLLGLGPERVEHWIGELLPGDTRADRRATKPQLLHAMDELLHGQIRVLKRHRGEGDEAVRVVRAELRKLVVLDADDFGCKIALRAVPVRVDTERLHVDALLVHLPDAPLAHLVDPRAALLCHRSAAHRERFRYDAVRMHVDGFDALPADFHDAATTRRLRLGFALRTRSLQRAHGVSQLAAGKSDIGHRDGSVFDQIAMRVHVRLPG